MLIDLDTALVAVRCQHQNPILVQHTCTYLTYKDAPVSGSPMFPCDGYVVYMMYKCPSRCITKYLRSGVFMMYMCPRYPSNYIQCI